ncbi:DNA/RNA polymerase [Russula compacta]|nr:DNA/RNA polymerase [Russula compacta]
MFPTSPLKKLASRKEKSKFTPQDEFTDLNPPITYRHLLSPPPGARDPLRVIALCDSDAFYAACEQVRLGIDPSRPLVVRQWDALIAVNYPARTFGITRMSNWRDALKKCPELTVVHVATYKEGDQAPGYWDNPDTATHKVSLDYYRRESAKIITIFKDSLPDGEIEKASIDEAFIDFTRPVRAELLARYPYLAEVPPDAPHGLDTVLPSPPPISWESRGILIPVDPPPEDEAGPTHGSMEAADGDGDASRTWHDVALSIAAELMDKIRAEVRIRLGYTTSAGIARNKFLSKLTASYKKRDSQSILRNAAIPNYLMPMPFQKIRFLGGKLGQAIADKFEVSSVGDLLPISLEEIQQKFGEDSIWVYEILRGIDRTEVREKPTLTKSMMASKNLPRPITKPSEGLHWLRVLAAELALRLNELRATDLSVWPKTIVLHARHRYDGSRSKQAPFPFARNVTVDMIAGLADRLWKDLVGSGSKQDGSLPYPVTTIAIGFSGVESGEVGQQNIEGFFLSGASTKPPSPSSSDRHKNERIQIHHRKRLREEGDEEGSSLGVQGISRENVASFVCTRCHKRIEIEPGDDGEGEPEERRTRALTRLRLEHDDFHFAEDMAKMPDDGNVGRSPGLRAVERERKRKKDTRAGRDQPQDVEGIAKFLVRRPG